MATPIAVPTPYLPINPYVVPGSQTQPLEKQDYPIQSLSSGAGVKFSSGQVLPAYAVKNVPQTNYSNVASAQATNAIPTKPTGYQQDSGFSMKYYPGWGETEARADWNATGGAKASNYDYSVAAGVETPTYNIGGQDVTASSPTEAIKSVFPTTDYEKYASQYDNDPTRFINDINSMYSGGDTFLNERESALRTALNEFNKLIEGDYALNMQKGTQAKESSKSTLASNKTKAQETKQSALNAARQLYTQLEQSARQRFGGSGAGKAALAILGQEQQRQGGQIQRDYQSTAANIDQKMYEVDTQYNTLVQELDQAKQKAIYDSNQNFQNQLSTISQNRLLNQQSKQQAIMEIMLKFRDDQNAIVAANEEYKRNLDLMKQEAMLQAGNYQSGFNTASNQFAQTGNQLTGDYTNKYSNISSNLTPSNNQTSVQTSSSPYQSMTGYMPWMGYEDKDKQQSVMY